MKVILTSNPDFPFPRQKVQERRRRVWGFIGQTLLLAHAATFMASLQLTSVNSLGVEPGTSVLLLKARRGGRPFI